MSTPKYIFCINAGRCGSDYLSRIFATAPGCVATHEPVPRCVGEPMQAFLHGRPAALKKLMPEKIRAIEDARGDACYFESSNAFIKGFGWLIPEHLPQERIGVVILRRDPHRIASSYLRIGTTALTNRGRKWHILPSIPAPLAPPPRFAFDHPLDYRLAWVLSAPFRRRRLLSYLLRFLRLVPALGRRLDEYERASALWYAEEVYRMADRYRQTFPGIRYFETTVEELNDSAHVTRMLNHFGLEAGAELEQVLGAPTNLKDNHPRD